MHTQKSLRADILLLLATLTWGMTFPLMSIAMHYVSSPVFVAIRFFVAGLVLIPFFWKKILKADRRTFYFGLWIGAINAVIYVAQAQGMVSIDAAQGAFITGLNVVFVPLLLPLFGMGKPKTKDLFCAMICLAGIFLLTGAGFQHVKVGVYWVAVGAFFVALSILALQKASQESKHLDALAFYQIFLTSFLVYPFTMHDSYHAILHIKPLLAVGFCAIMATSFALLIQTRYQRLTSPSRAALIFALEPVFATFFSYFLNGEAMTWRILVGGGIILGSIVVSELC